MIKQLEIPAAGTRSRGRPKEYGMGYEPLRLELLDLLGRVADGDRVAFSELYDLVASRIFGLSHRLLGDRASAERATRESFLEIWRRAPHYDASTSRPVTWMLAIAHRRARAMLAAAAHTEEHADKIA